MLSISLLGFQCIYSMNHINLMKCWKWSLTRLLNRFVRSLVKPLVHLNHHGNEKDEKAVCCLGWPTSCDFFWHPQIYKLWLSRSVRRGIEWCLFISHISLFSSLSSHYSRPVMCGWPTQRWSRWTLPPSLRLVSQLLCLRPTLMIFYFVYYYCYYFKSVLWSKAFDESLPFPLLLSLFIYVSLYVFFCWPSDENLLPLVAVSV